MENYEELKAALQGLYDLCREDGFGKGWKRGQNGMRNAEIALKIKPRLSPYTWDKREFEVVEHLEVRKTRDLVETRAS